MAFGLSVILTAAAAAGCAYLLMAIVLVARFVHRPDPPVPAATPSVTVLKPLCGDEPDLLKNLASFCRQDYRGPIQVICGVQEERDPALATVKELQRAESGVDIILVLDERIYGLNRKVSNLVNMAERIRHEIVILADSDIRVDSVYLARVVAALQRSGNGAVTCLYYGVGLTGAWGSLSALGINAHFLPSVVVALSLGWVRPCFGSTIALRRETLAAIGGFSAFADSLADDFAIGQALRHYGRDISIPPFAVAHMCPTGDASELWNQELRWARTIKSIDPAGYAGSIFGHPLPLALLAATLGLGSITFEASLVIAALSIALRLALLFRVERSFKLPRQAYWLVPVRDLMSFGVFVASFFGRIVSWRGHQYREVHRGTWTANGGVHRP
jgi:ceramide glucosyltransferase